MASKFAVLLAAAAVGACSHTAQDQPDRGLASVNVPVITRTDYVLDVSAPGGPLGPGEAARLNAWFSSLDLRYGDVLYVDGGYAGVARADVSRVADAYGMLVTPGAPVTPGAVQPGTVRVVVSRPLATVPNCPNWSRPAQPNFNNRNMSNLGCAVNSNMAAMVANPEDLIHGREGLGSSDSRTAVKGITFYRTSPPTGNQGLKDISTKKEDK